MKNFAIAVYMLIIAGLGCGSNASAQAKNDNIHYITDTTLNFNQLVSRFKGKVIYVDIWASWCGPCKKELRNAKQLKDFQAYAKRNDIVILYICCDKTGDQWRSFISANHLSGYHILVNEHLNNDFHTTFSSVQKRRGVMKRSFYLPRHIIVDKMGAVADSAVSYQGDRSVYLQLEKLLH